MVKRETINIIKKYVDYLIKMNLPIKKAYLFGSHAKGTYNEDSDIDIALIFPYLEDEIDMQILLMKAGTDFDSRIEPYPFEENYFNVYHPLADEIIKTGYEIQ
jgi:uncharacterized protein